MRKITFQFCFVALVALLFVQCSKSSDVAPVANQPVEKAIIKISPVLTSEKVNDTTFSCTVSLAEEFCNTTNGIYCILQLWGAPVGSTGQGHVVLAKNIAGVSCIKDINLEYVTHEPTTLIAVLKIYNGTQTKILAFGSSNSVVVE